MSCKYSVPRNLGSSKHRCLLLGYDLLKKNPVQTCTNRNFSTCGNMSVVSAKHFPGIPGVSRTVKNFMALNFKCRGKEWKKHLRPFLSVSLLHAQGKHGVNIPYPFNIQENGQNISNFYRCMGLTADSIINHRNLAQVCKSMQKCPRFFSDCKNNTY